MNRNSWTTQMCSNFIYKTFYSSYKVLPKSPVESELGKNEVSPSCLPVFPTIPTGATTSIQDISEISTAQNTFWEKRKHRNKQNWNFAWKSSARLDLIWEVFSNLSDCEIFLWNRKKSKENHDGERNPSKSREHFLALQVDLYLEHCAGLFIEVHSGDDTSGVLLHVKNAGAVGELYNVHLVVHPTRWGALQCKKRSKLGIFGFLHNSRRLKMQHC